MSLFMLLLYLCSVLAEVELDILQVDKHVLVLIQDFLKGDFKKLAVSQRYIIHDYNIVKFCNIEKTFYLAPPLRNLFESGYKNQPGPQLGWFQNLSLCSAQFFT